MCASQLSVYTQLLLHLIYFLTLNSTFALFSHLCMFIKLFPMVRYRTQNRVQHSVKKRIILDHNMFLATVIFCKHIYSFFKRLFYINCYIVIIIIRCFLYYFNIFISILVVHNEDAAGAKSEQIKYPYS